MRNRHHLQFTDPRVPQNDSPKLFENTDNYHNVIDDLAVSQFKNTNVDYSNHNGWLGAQHVFYRSKSLFRFGKSYLLPNRTVVIAMSSGDNEPNSWQSETNWLAHQAHDYRDRDLNIRIVEHFCSTHHNLKKT